MSRTSLFHKSKGQSIPLIALIMVVLFGMVGLSVDVGNTYAQQRDIVRSTNAAALAGMEIITRERDPSLANDSNVGAAIRQSFESNNIKISDYQVNLAEGEDKDIENNVELGEFYLEAYYLDAGGNRILECPIGQCTNVPKDATYVEVSTEGYVGTYFARVVGQNTLPVNTVSYVGKCLPSDTVFPIAIPSEHLDENGFVDPGDGSYYNANGFANDANPFGTSVRRLSIAPTVNAPNSFSFVTWKLDSDLGTMLRGAGNVREGIEEASWPSSIPGKPDGYPTYPGEISPNDWLYGIPGWDNSGDVQFALDEHITSQTPMYLPIVSQGTNVGNGTAYLLNRIGVFYIVAKGNGSLDLAYVGDAKEEPCPHFPPDTPPEVTLEGNVFVRPNSVNSDGGPVRPIAYQVVLDVSGSMSWNIDGYGKQGGATVQCENRNDPAYSSTCEHGENSGWDPVGERRIALAKDAINELIDNMSDADQMRIIAYSTSPTFGGANVEAYPADGMTGDQARLEAAVEEAGQWDGHGAFSTRGSTSSAQAMQLTGQLVEQAPDTAPDGREYRDVVIYLTDGVANVFLDGSRNTAPEIPECAAMDPNTARNTANPCQLGTRDDGKLRPITALINESNKIKQRHTDMDLFVVAMGPADNAGLKEVASDSGKMYPANTPDAVKQIFKLIQEDATDSTCRTYTGEYTSSIAGHEVPGGQGLPAKYATADGVHGYVTISDTTGKKNIRVPIYEDDATGNLFYRVSEEEKLVSGSYTLTAFLNYKGDDGVARAYERITSINDPEGTTQISFTIDQEQFGTIVDGPTLALDIVNDEVCST